MRSLAAGPARAFRPDQRRGPAAPPAALLGLHLVGAGDDAPRPGRELPRHLALCPARPAGARRRRLPELAQDRGPGRHHRLDAGQPAQRHPHRHRPATPRGRCTRSRTKAAASASARSPASSAASRAAARAGAGWTSAAGAASSAPTISGASAATRRSAELMARTLTLGEFAPRLGKPFSVEAQNGAIQLVLAGAWSFGSMRDGGAFRLEFHGLLQPTLAQGTYCSGRRPAGRDLHRPARSGRRKLRYEAIFLDPRPAGWPRRPDAIPSRDRCPSRRPG